MNYFGNENLEQSIFTNKLRSAVNAKIYNYKTVFLLVFLAPFIQLHNLKQSERVPFVPVTWHSDKSTLLTTLQVVHVSRGLSKQVCIRVQNTVGSFSNEWPSECLVWWREAVQWQSEILFHCLLFSIHVLLLNFVNMLGKRQLRIAANYIVFTVCTR